MPRKSDRPLQDYVDYLNGILNQTITHSRLAILRRGSHLYITRYQSGVLPLELEPQGYFHFRQLANVQPDGKVVVEECRYIFSLSDNPDDEQQWIFRHEYCLKPEGNKPHAHLHVNARRGRYNLRHIHFPTARISMEQIIAHLIIEHGVKCRKSDWFQFLADSHKGWMERRTDLELSLFP